MRLRRVLAFVRHDLDEQPLVELRHAAVSVTPGGLVADVQNEPADPGAPDGFGGTIAEVVKRRRAVLAPSFPIRFVQCKRGRCSAYGLPSLPVYLRSPKVHRMNGIWRSGL